MLWKQNSSDYFSDLNTENKLVFNYQLKNIFSKVK